MDRREWLGNAALGSAALGGVALGGLAASVLQAQQNAPRLKQSIAFWCFNAAGERWSLDRTCEVAKQLGCVSVELVGPEGYETIKKHGLVCAMSGCNMPSPPFVRGWNNPKFHEELLTNSRRAVDQAAEARFPNVIAFTGYKYREPDNPQSGEISRSDAADACVRGLRELANYAEKREVTICLEHLNTRDGSHPMKGHPGYQGDDIDWVADIVRRVRSPRVKVLFDVYHVQVMHGDVLRRIEQCRDVIGHIHTAGNPGRGELDDRQEINYPAVFRKLVEINYQGYIGHEFIPTRDPLAGLRQATGLV